MRARSTSFSATGSWRCSAHEDHARRAVHAALGIARTLAEYQRELAPRGISFRARQGLNTGLVVVGSIGSDLRMDYTAVGDTTNVAARLQQVGEPGQVTISDATHRLVRGYFDIRPLGDLHLKGKAETVVAARCPDAFAKVRELGMARQGRECDAARRVG
jgi:class 3 adenylate cyclase